MAQSKVKGKWAELVGGQHVVTAAEAAANEVVIDTGDLGNLLASLQIWRGTAEVTGDAVISCSGGILTVGDGSTYSVTEGDIIGWVAV